MNRLNVVREHVNSFTARDWDRYRKTVLPNVIYDEQATGRRVEGVDDLLKALETWTVAFPDLRGTIKNLLTQEDMVMAEIVWEGTHDGLLKGPFGEVPATGKPGVVNAVEIFHFEGDKIRECRHYFDVMTVLNQVGAPAAVHV